MDSKNILIIDDNKENIKVASAVLKEAGLNISFATSGARGIEVVRENEIDLILLDILMPMMDGFRTCEIIRDELGYRDIPIIFLTASDSEDSIKKAFEVGGVDYVTKPFRSAELQSRVFTQLRLSEFNKNLQKAIKTKSEALEKSFITDRESGIYNAAKLTHDLDRDERVWGVMIKYKDWGDLIQTYGFDVGNRAVLELARTLREYVAKRNFDTVLYRFSADEFIIICSDKNKQEVLEAIEGIRECIRSSKFHITERMSHSFNVWISYSRSNRRELLQHLKLAQMEAQNANSGIEEFNPRALDMLQKQENNFYWMSKIQDSLEQEMIIPFYQPIVDSRNGSIVKYECLARLKDEGRIVSPGEFIPSAIDMGLIPEITVKILTSAYKDVGVKGYSFSVNITEADLKRGHLLELLENLGKIYSVSPSQVTLEILEDISVYGSNDVIDQLKSLKDAGFILALDDFGSEQASFSRIMDLEVDQIKIDGQFIKHLNTCKRSQVVVETITSMAKALKCECIAEFVHSKEVLNKVVEFGIEYSQGFYFYKPLEQPIKNGD
ncbi:MAG: EAL domain-containing protein [Campylobacterales bacterium]